MSEEQGNFKERFWREMRRYAMIVIFLTLLSFAFSAYRRMISHQYNIPFHFGFGFIESLILGKVIMLGQFLKLGERFETKSLIIPTLYKTFVFTLFVFVFSILEHFIVGAFHGRSFFLMYQDLLSQSIWIILCKTLIQFFVFIFLFAFIELASVFGEDKLFDLFFRRKD